MDLRFNNVFTNHKVQTERYTTFKYKKEYSVLICIKTLL